MGFIINPYAYGVGASGGTDDFSSNTIANYTTRAGSWSISSGAMDHTATSGAIITKNGVSWANGTVSASVLQGGNCGIIARYQDNSNFYLAVVRDASSGSGTPNTIQLYKRVAGAYTSLGNTTISWTRNSPKTVELVLSGTSLTVNFDGVTKIGPVTDSAHGSAGGVGMWGDTLPNRWDSFTWT